MQKNLQSESGRFNPRIAAAAALCLIGTSLGMLSFAQSTQSSSPVPVAGVASAGATVIPSEFNGDVRTLTQTITDTDRQAFLLRPEFEGPEIGMKQLLPGARAEVPSPDVSAISAPMPKHIVSFPGMADIPCGAGHPPDTVGDVGPNHFVQAVNTSVGIYDKSTGAALANFTFSSLWNGAATGTSCDNLQGGDPTVIYDPQHDRFIVADFSWVDFNNGPFYECVAVSKTSDPVNGGWYLYGIRADDAAHPWFPDYPKMGIWPDGLYMTANMFDSSSQFRESRVYAFNINDLVTGATLRSVVVDEANEYSMLPSNYRGTAPSAGTPNYVVAESSTALYAWRVYAFQPNYSNPASSTFLGPINVSQASYVVAANTVPQPSPGNATDTLADRAMMQNQYRNINGVESLWVNHTTGPAGISGSGLPTRIQWAQIYVTAGNINTTPVQEQIFNNGLDGMNRFMGSLAVDHVGNMALGYTASSSTVAPDIRYVGRLATDPLNTLPQTEVTMLPSVTRSVQTGNCGPGQCTRWGDYSAMTVDPVDDCTFWYTTMYYSTTGSFNWRTRIGNFKFPSCVSTPHAAIIPISSSLTTESCNPSNGVIDPGETVTLRFCV